MTIPYKKIISYGIFAIIIVAVLNMGYIVLIAKWRPEIKQADAIIVLGAAINTPALNNRTLEGLHLYEQGKADVMILSGGKISEPDISEAEYMEKIIKKNTKDTIAYVLEDQSHNTYENIFNSIDKIGKKESLIIVSDEFHLARAVLVAKRAGFETVYWSAPKPTYYDSSELRRYYIREFFAMINYIPKLIFG